MHSCVHVRAGWLTLQQGRWALCKSGLPLSLSRCACGFLLSEVEAFCPPKSLPLTHTHTHTLPQQVCCPFSFPCRRVLRWWGDAFHWLDRWTDTWRLAYRMPFPRPPPPSLLHFLSSFCFWWQDQTLQPLLSNPIKKPSEKHEGIKGPVAALWNGVPPCTLLPFSPPPAEETDLSDYCISFPRKPPQFISPQPFII